MYGTVQSILVTESEQYRTVLPVCTYFAADLLHRTGNLTLSPISDSALSRINPLCHYYGRHNCGVCTKYTVLVIDSMVVSPLTPLNALGTTMIVINNIKHAVVLSLSVTRP